MGLGVFRVEFDGRAKTITVVVKGDKKKEANENFFVDLSDLSSYAVFLDSQGMGTIQNDD